MGLIEQTPVPISQYEKEFEFLLRIFKERQPTSILEIGTHHGGSFYHWIKEAPTGAIVNSIDNQHINSDLYDDWANVRRVEVNWFNGDSTSNEALQWAKFDAPYDFIFIDGDHSFNGVMDDYVLAAHLIKRPGIIAFHDITPHPYREVDEAWNLLKIINEWEEVVDLNYPVNDRCGIGILYFD